MNLSQSIRDTFINKGLTRVFERPEEANGLKVKFYEELLQNNIDQSHLLSKECIIFTLLREITLGDPSMYSDTSLPLDINHKCRRNLNMHCHIIDTNQEDGECNKLCYLTNAAHITL